MSLFKKSENKKAEQSPASSANAIEIPETHIINISDKMIRVELVEEEAYIKYGEIEQNGDSIRIISGNGILIAEISKRSKAYTELKEKIGQRIQWIVLKTKQGDYGRYYQAKIRFDNTIIVPISEFDNGSAQILKQAVEDFIAE